MPASTGLSEKTLRITDNSDLRKRLIIGLDVPNIGHAESLVHELGDSVSFYKIGYQLAFAGGLDLAKDLISDGKKIFLDMKLLDIENTISKAVENIIQMGVTMLTLHAYPKAMESAVNAAKGSSLCLLGVTVLTSLNDHDLVLAGYGSKNCHALVMQRAQQARDAGMGGIICPPEEVENVSKIVGSNFALVTPGIRPSGFASHEHRRPLTPQEVLYNGATHIVIARPVIEAPNKPELIQDILLQMKNAQEEILARRYSKKPI